MLLHIMSLPRNIAAHHLSRRQSNLRSLTLSGVGLLGFGNADFQTHAFHARAVLVRHGWGDGTASGLRSSRGAADLIEGCAKERGGVKRAAAMGEERLPRWARDAAREAGSGGRSDERSKRVKRE